MVHVSTRAEHEIGGEWTSASQTRLQEQRHVHAIRRVGGASSSGSIGVWLCVGVCGSCSGGSGSGIGSCSLLRLHSCLDSIRIVLHRMRRHWHSDHCLCAGLWRAIATNSQFESNRRAEPQRKLRLMSLTRLATRSRLLTLVICFLSLFNGHLVLLSSCESARRSRAVSLFVCFVCFVLAVRVAHCASESFRLVSHALSSAAARQNRNAMHVAASESRIAGWG